jgi:hypothetical protein
MVNTIKIEEIVDSAFKLLKITNYKNINTLFIGNRCNDQVIEFVPDQIIRADFAKDSVLNMRIDLVDGDVNENIVHLNLRNRKFNVFMTNNKFVKNIDAFNVPSENLVNVIFDITDGYVNYEYINMLFEKGITPKIRFRGKDDDTKLNNARIDMLDLGFEFIVEKENQKEIDNLVKILQSDICSLRTNRIVLSDNKVFLSEWHLKAKLPSKSKKTKIENNQDLNMLAKEAEFFLIYKELNND